MSYVYTDEEYQNDLQNPEMPHLDSADRFKAFYEKLAEGSAKDIQYPASRMNWVKIEPEASIIELGCQSGYNVVRWLQQHPSCTVVAVDVSGRMLTNTMARVKAELPSYIQDNVSYVESFIEELPKLLWLQPRFSDVVLTETLEHVQDPQKCLEVAWWLVRPGGTLWITTPTRRWGNYSHVRGIRAATLASMVQDVGVDVAWIEEIDEVPHQGEPITRARIVKPQY